MRWVVLSMNVDVSKPYYFRKYRNTKQKPVKDNLVPFIDFHLSKFSQALKSHYLCASFSKQDQSTKAA